VSAILIEGCAIATVDAARSEHADGHVLVDGDHILSVGPGRPVQVPDGTRRIDGRGLLATPGLVNCHHHLYQWATRGLATEANLFQWLVALYPTWARIDAGIEHAAASAGIAALALSGCSTTMDHHYVFPRDGGDLLLAEIEAARSIGVRFHPCRGSMDLGASAGGLPPDEVVEDRDAVLAATEDAIRRYHDPSPTSMLRIAVAPCSPFSVTGALMRDAAELARRHGVRLHTHMAETVEEEAFCLELFGCRPVDYLDQLGWLGSDVWLAHCVHLSDSEIARFGATRTGVAHCPSSNARLGAGIAPVRDLLAAGAPVGLGVDGAASNEAGELQIELRQALFAARLRGGAAAMTCRDALALGTIHGARCLGREAEIGSLEAGKRADVALWRIDDLGGAGIADPVAALVLGPQRRVETLLVAGRVVVDGGELRTRSEQSIAAEIAAASRLLAARAGAGGR
jgi:cytosine/adenosine deaminase-related metal-dependent hydrolase